MEVLLKEWDLIGEAEIRIRSAQYPDLLACYDRMKMDSKSAVGLIISPYMLGLFEATGRHDAVLFSLAMQQTASFQSNLAHRIMPEATFRVENEDNRICNVLRRVGYDLVRPTLMRQRNGITWA